MSVKGGMVLKPKLKGGMGLKSKAKITEGIKQNRLDPTDLQPSGSR